MSTPEPHRLSAKTKLAFGIGGAAETIVLFSVTTYAMFFYNQVHGLPAHLAGVAIFLSLILDGLVDPLVGSISDRTRGPLGRRHAYMFAAPVPIVLAFFAIFNPPAGLGELALFAWFSVSVITMRCAMAFFHVPHLALGGELSPDYTERTRVMAWNNFFVFVGGASISLIALTFFFRPTPEQANGLLNQSAYAPFSVVAALSTLAILVASAWWTRDQIPRLPQPPANLPKFSPFEFVKDMGKAFTNINYVWLLVAYLFLSMMVGVRGGLGLYTGTFLFGLSPQDLRWYVIGSFTGYLAALLFSARLHGRYDKKNVIMWSAAIYAIAPAVAPTLRVLDLFFANGDPMLLPTLVALSILSYGSAAVLTISVMSALADVADENEVKHGVRQEGVLYATRALFAKVDQAIGSLLAGLALTWIAFPERAKPGEVPEGVLDSLAWVDGVIAGIPGLIAVYFYGRYGIDWKAWEATRRRLAEMRPTIETPPALPPDLAPGGGGISPAPAPAPKS